MAEMLTYAPDLRSITGGRGRLHDGVPALRGGPRAPRAEGRRQLARGGGDGLAAAVTRPCAGRRAATLVGLDSASDLDAARDRHLRRLRAHAAARRARRRLPARRRAPLGLRAVHAARGARGLDPRGRRRRARPRPRGWSRGGGAGVRCRAPAPAPPRRGVELLVPEGAESLVEAIEEDPLRGAAAGRSRRSRRPRRSPSAARRRRAADVPRGPLRPRDPDERRHEGRARDRAVQREPASAHHQRASRARSARRSSACARR